ncbi:DUF4232 domain-containing protein [Streptomyces sp. NPDC005426]|uniref:DUF4232 domain-containing protein n=1 Tax=Streptomyces sp. NPDC005426 TaxID=3155344 RepID=UPI0033ACFEC1
MSSLSRTTPPSSGRSRRPRSGRAARKARTLRRHVLVPVAIASITLAAAGCGGAPDASGQHVASTGPHAASSGPHGATGSAPAGSAPGAASPSDGSPSAPSANTGAAEGPSDQDSAGRGTTAGTGAGSGTGTRRCTAEGLAMNLGRADAGAGQIYYRLTFANKSTTACALRGFPGVSLIKRDGSVIGVPAEREGAMREQTVIAPGGTAEVTLHTLNQGIKDSGCWSRPDYLRVYPPGSKEALTLRTSALHVCGDRFTTTAVAG